jgi:hypothetical protein
MNHSVDAAQNETYALRHNQSRLRESKNFRLPQVGLSDSPTPAKKKTQIREVTTPSRKGRGGRIEGFPSFSNSFPLFLSSSRPHNGIDTIATNWKLTGFRTRC